jgi:hypothetical protein
MLRVTLPADEEGRLGCEEKEQWSKRAEGDDIQVEVYPAKLNQQLQPEHVGAMSRVGERTAEDGARNLDLSQDEHTHGSFPPHARGNMCVVQEERCWLQVGVSGTYSKVVRVAEAPLLRVV